jgi:hypothetical protein
MNYRFGLMFVLSLTSCAHYSAPKVVQFPYAPELLASIQTASISRAPASEPLEAKEDKSSRRVYFSTLYHQFVTLGVHLKTDATLQSCPQFHHDRVEIDSYPVPTVTQVNSGSIQEEGRAFFPELVFQNKKTLATYHSDLRHEVETLCEEGLSDNFYKFDNLVTHYADKKSFHLRPQAMESVLKIPIFANFYLLKMMESKHELNFSYPEEKLFIKMTRTHWFENYVIVASQKRQAFLQNKMVKR